MGIGTRFSGHSSRSIGVVFVTNPKTRVFSFEVVDKYRGNGCFSIGFVSTVDPWLTTP